MLDKFLLDYSSDFLFRYILSFSISVTFRYYCLLFYVVFFSTHFVEIVRILMNGSICMINMINEVAECLNIYMYLKFIIFGIFCAQIFIML